MTYEKDRDGPLIQETLESDMLHYTTTIESRNEKGQGNADPEILKKFDSMVAPNISFSNYKDEGIRSQMWMASFIADRVINSYSDEEYDPLILAQVKAMQSNIYAKVNLGKEGRHNILKIIKSIWSHAETVTSSKHDESIKAKGIRMSKRQG